MFLGHFALVIPYGFCYISPLLFHMVFGTRFGAIFIYNVQLGRTYYVRTLMVLELSLIHI